MLLIARGIMCSAGQLHTTHFNFRFLISSKTTIRYRWIITMEVCCNTRMILIRILCIRFSKLDCSGEWMGKWKSVFLLLRTLDNNGRDRREKRYSDFSKSCKGLHTHMRRVRKEKYSPGDQRCFGTNCWTDCFAWPFRMFTIFLFYRMEIILSNLFVQVSKQRHFNSSK